MKYRLNIALVVCLIITGCQSIKAAEAPKEAAPWDQMHAILARIKPPTFPNKQFTITDYGAVEGENNDSSEAIRKAIEACNKAGGGRVVVPPGKWLSGPITLKSNVNLHLNEGSTILFKTDPKAYLPPVLTRFESVECYNFSPFIYALEQENIAVTGTGTLDGQASNQHWWPWVNARFGWQQGMPTAQKGKLNAMGQNGTPVEQRIMGENDGLRPNFFQPYRCKNVMIEGVHIRRSPMWEINPVLCTNVIVRNLDIVSHGPNNDGCDPECCKDVLIEGCLFDTGDDCIAIKSGRNNDGRRVNVASENLIIRNCTMKDGHGGVTIGSEIAGSCRNVFVEDCKMDSPNLNAIFRFKSNAQRG
ncbi:MAG TPA: glycoside hydrolase family 28 protein, partial [Tepidisphaeraceae bacterium]|nr:glycoside hydrolase family 28 protein [Tepidisphaeraceae bacterium]